MTIKEWFSDIKKGQKLFLFKYPQCEYIEGNLVSINYLLQTISLDTGDKVKTEVDFDDSYSYFSPDGKSVRIEIQNFSTIIYKDKKDARDNLLPILEARAINIDNAIFFLKH